MSTSLILFISAAGVVQAFVLAGLLYFEQPAGKKLWTANTMLRTINGKMEPNQIDLNGLPW